MSDTRDTAKPRRSNGLTQEGWSFLLQLLEEAGYRPFDDNGQFVARQILREHFFYVLEPNARPIENLERVAREQREDMYTKLGVRLNRIRPGHPQETVTEETLRALAALPGLSDPNFLIRPDIHELVKDVIVPRDPRKIDFLRFIRKLTVPRPTKEGASKLSEVQCSTSAQKANVAMYLGGVSFSISKSFGNLQLVPEAGGIRLLYTPFENGKELTEGPACLNLVLPLEAIGGLLGAAIAFFEQKECLDENVILWGDDIHDTLIKLYRDKPQGADNRLNGTENCWLRLVTGPTEVERRRIRLLPRDLIALIEALRMTALFAAVKGTHAPRPIPPTFVHREFNPAVISELESKSLAPIPPEAAGSSATQPQAENSEATL